MQTISAEQFKAKYGEAGLSKFSTPTSETPIDRITETVGSDLANRADKFGEILRRKDTGIVEKGTQLFGQGAGLAAGALETVASEIPGVKEVSGAIGQGLQWLATSDLSPLKHLGDVIGNSKTLQEATLLYDTDENFRDTVDAVGNIVRLGGDIDGVVNSANFAANVTNKVIKGVSETASAASNLTEPITSKATQVVAETTKNAPADIMNRVARLKPTDSTKFEKMFGQSHGQYLSETGNFGSPDKIIGNEATKFTNSLKSVDEALSKLPGTYKDGSIKDALLELYDKAKKVSSSNVEAPYLQTVKDFIKKYNGKGLSMSEINEIKRLFEKKVKLGYNKLLNADKVEQATNIDSAIRNWQVKKASELGFKNISDINRQTQMSKFIIDKLGSQLVGQSGLNAVNLTDWIVLSGGSPQSIAGFLTKKFFSSKTVQAKIAEMLKTGTTKGPIAPQIESTPLLRAETIKAFPTISPRSILR